MVINNKPDLIRFDWALKHMLRDKANFDILEGFLCAVLEEDDLHILQIVESESDRDLDHLKYNRVDLLVTDSEGRYMIIEVQNQHESDYLYRLLFGAAKVIIDTLNLGQSYKDIAKVISISIQYFNLGIGNDYVYYGCNRFVGLNTQEPLRLRQQAKAPNGKVYLREVNIEKEIFPEYYLIQVERFEDQIKKPMDEWIYMLKHETVPEYFQAKNIDRARQKLAVMKMDEKDKRRYDHYLMDLASERDVLETAHREGHSEGHKAGHEEGYAEGQKEGYKEGQKEGYKEGQKEGELVGKREIARAMLANGYDVLEVAKMTGLTVEGINKLED